MECRKTPNPKYGSFDFKAKQISSGGRGRCFSLCYLSFLYFIFPDWDEHRGLKGKNYRYSPRSTLLKVAFQLRFFHLNLLLICAKIFRICRLTSNALEFGCPFGIVSGPINLTVCKNVKRMVSKFFVRKTHRSCDKWYPC